MSLIYFINKSKLSLFLLIFMLIVMASNAISKAKPIFSKCYEKATTTVDQRECLSKEYKYYDQILNSKYQILMKMLPSLGKKKLLLSQRAWIQFRNKECDFASYQEYGGTLQLIILDDCYIQFTKKRIQDFRNYLKHYKEI